jgi:hypothetical protein
MRALLNGGNAHDGLGNHMEEFRAEIRNLGRTIEQLATKVTTIKNGSDF